MRWKQYGAFDAMGHTDRSAHLECNKIVLPCDKESCNCDRLRRQVDAFCICLVDFLLFHIFYSVLESIVHVSQQFITLCIVNICIAPTDLLLLLLLSLLVFLCYFVVLIFATSQIAVLDIQCIQYRTYKL